MRRWIALVVLCAGCNTSTPTAPTPPPVSAPPPVVTTPPPTTPAAPPRLPLSDPRFDLAFYRQFAHDALTLNNTGVVPLRRQTQAPRIYLRTIDDAGVPIDAFTLDATAAALINTAGKLTGVFGLAGLEQGTSSRLGEPGWITVFWSATPHERFCGEAHVGGQLIRLYPKTPRCGCQSGQAVSPAVVKHELGHSLGFWHTDSPNDLMYHIQIRGCDVEPSAREVFHAAVAYSMPVGSLPVVN